MIYHTINALDKAVYIELATKILQEGDDLVNTRPYKVIGMYKKIIEESIRILSNSHEVVGDLVK